MTTFQRPRNGRYTPPRRRQRFVEPTPVDILDALSIIHTDNGCNCSPVIERVEYFVHRPTYVGVRHADGCPAIGNRRQLYRTTNP